MIKIENWKVVGWEHAIKGMRNPLESHHKLDSRWRYDGVGADDEFESDGNNPVEEYADYGFYIGSNDLDLMKRLSKAGTDHRKYMRMITVYMDITAPLYWWKEFDTYKIATVANSCSTMHKIHAKEFTLDDFSHEHLLDDEDELWEDIMNGVYGDLKMIRGCLNTPLDDLYYNIDRLNMYREIYLKINEALKSNELYGADPVKQREKLKYRQKRVWWQMIQSLPTTYNQKRTIMLNYEVLANMYKSRKNHKLDEWRKLCEFIESLPYSELITGEYQEVNRI